MHRHFLSALVLLIVGTVPVAAADLTKIDRTIAKEPAYKGKPKYCLLVFGPDRTKLSRWRYRRAAKAVSEKAACLVWLAG